MESFWADAGKLLLLISAAVGLIKIWEWVKGARQHLQGSYRIQKFLLPNAVTAHLKKGKHQGETLPPDVEAIAESEWFGLHIASGEITNDGSVPLEDVEITVSGAVLWEIPARSLEAKDSQQKESFVIGKLKAGETIQFRVWFSSNFGYIPEEKRVKILHKAGLGKLRVFRSVGPVGYFADQLATPTGIAIAILLATSFFTLIQSISHLRSKSSETKATPTAETQQMPAQKETTAAAPKP